MLLDPEYPLINQGEEGTRFYFIKHGELEVFVKDPKEHRDMYVKSLKDGDFFGEISLIRQVPRSASVRPKSYAKVGYLSKEKFDEMVYLFPVIKSKLKNHLASYDDDYKLWQKKQLRNIMFMRYLPE